MNGRKILITGLGGDLAQALAKCVRLMDMPVRIIGADCTRDSIAPAFADDFRVLPRADACDYLPAVQALCAAEGYDALVPGSCAEMETLARALHEGRVALPCPVICQPHQTIAQHGDKLESYAFLEGKVALAGFADGGKAQEVQRLAQTVGFPLVVKPRLSSGSRNIHTVHNSEELEHSLRAVPLPVVQEYIPGDDSEFSVGVYVKGVEHRVLAFRRKLGPVGASWEAETVDEPQAQRYCLAIAQATGMQGSFNVQIRIGSNGPALLEINPRFSSLVAARAYCGFRDLEWSLMQAWSLPYSLPAFFSALRFRRFFHELVDTGTGYHAPEPWLPRRSTQSTGSAQ